MPDPRPPPAPTIVPFVMNSHPFYDTIKLVSDSITVDAILERAARTLEYRFDVSKLRLRWIADKSAAFSSQHDLQLESLRRRDAIDWYFDKGHCLASKSIKTDGCLRKRLRRHRPRSSARAGARDAQPEVVRLYVVAPATSPEIVRQRYILYNRRPPRGIQHEDCSILTRMATLYEPAFAYAENALRDLQDVKLDGEKREDGNACSVEVPVDDGKAVDETLDARLFVAHLRDALGSLKVGRPDSEEGTHAEALGKLFQQLFDDPTLKVNVTSSGVDGDPWTKLDIKGRCTTAYGVPALYVVGADKLMSSRGTEGAPDVPEGMLAYRHAILKSKYTPVCEATCCPCLIIETAGATVQLYAAYFADRVYRSHICGFALDGSAPVERDTDSDEHRRDAVKLQVVRNTARMLRQAYARVHTGDPLPHPTSRPQLLPRPSIIMPTPLPCSLHLLDRVTLGALSDVFTGTLKLPTRDDSDGTESELPVHVKFVEEYGVAAHRLLAAHRDTDKVDGSPLPLAPQLYWAGEIMPGLMMIVMQTLPSDARMLSSYDLEPQSTSPSGLGYRRAWRPRALRPVAWEELGDVRAAVELLHAHGFVHGDIRPGNVMLQRPACGSLRKAARAYLIDFDWAGREGEVRYPAMLNPDVKWPRPASELSGQPIRKVHDLFMLENQLLPRRLKRKREDALSKETWGDEGQGHSELEVEYVE